MTLYNYGLHNLLRHSNTILIINLTRRANVGANEKSRFNGQKAARLIRMRPSKAAVITTLATVAQLPLHEGGEYTDEIAMH